MKTFYSFFLLFIISSTTIFSQTYDPNPISSENRISISDLCAYKNKVAIVTTDFSDTSLQVFVHLDNIWSALPNRIIENGIERKIPYNSYGQYIKNKIQFDSKGSIWVFAYDGLYQFEESSQQWTYFAVPNVNENVTSYKYFTVDSLDNVWTIAEVYRGTATEYADSNTFGDTNYIHLQTELYMLKDGAFTRFFEDTSSSPLKFNPYSNQYYADINSNSLYDGILFRNYSSKPYKDLIHIKSDGSFNDYEFPTTDLDLYAPVTKYANYIFNDSKNRLWALMDMVSSHEVKYRIYSCCAGVARLDNNSQWYKFNNVDNLMPHTIAIVDSVVKYSTPLFISELVNDEILFIMRENHFSTGKNPKLYKLKSDNKFYRDFWKPYLEAATVYRSDPVRISDENMKIVIETFKNETFLEEEIVPLYGMKKDGIGNIWIWGSQFIMKVPINPTTSVAESIKKPTIIYPNPGNKSIRLSNSGGDVSKIEILNVTGTVVRTVTENTIEIPVNDLSSGMYFVKIYSQNGNIEVLKYVKE